WVAGGRAELPGGRGGYPRLRPLVAARQLRVDLRLPPHVRPGGGEPRHPGADGQAERALPGRDRPAKHLVISKVHERRPRRFDVALARFADPTVTSRPRTARRSLDRDPDRAEHASLDVLEQHWGQRSAQG